MVKGWGRAARALAAAGALGVCGTAAAAPPEGPRSVGVEGMPGVAAARLAAMRVELAWLADPVTFAQPLEARVSGPALEVCGFVPDEVAKERALALARRHGGYLPVLDGLALDPSLPPRPTPAPATALRDNAVDLLRRSLGGAADGLRVSALGGVLTVDGPAKSVEEQLAVSRRLRQLSGCTAVVNRMSVAVLPGEGVALLPVSNDHTLLVRADDPGTSVPPVAPTAAAPNWADDRGPRPAWQPTFAPAPRTEDDPHSTFAAARGDGPTLPPPPEESGPSGFASAAGLPPVRATPANRAAVAEGKRTLPTTLPAVAELAADAKPAAAKAPPAVVAPPQPHTVKPPRQGWPTAYVGGEQVRPDAAPAATVPAAHKEEAAVPVTPVAAKDAAPAAAPPAAPPAHPAATLTPQQLRQRLQRACGRAVRQVEVTEQPDHSVAVRVYLANAAAEKNVTQLLVRMPELGTPGLKLEIMVPR